jgi:RES domain-containing protein
VIAWRVTPLRHDPWDATGATELGARWNSPGRPAVYASDTFAGALLEIVVHATRPRTLPGPHHAIRITIPDELVEAVDPKAIPGWDADDSAAARSYGNDWLASRRSAVLVVPALPSRPIGRTVMINPLHDRSAEIERSESFRVPWDQRLF